MTISNVSDQQAFKNNFIISVSKHFIKKKLNKCV